MTYLQRFPVTMVKIDQSFVAGLGQNPRDDAIVRAVNTLGSSLGMAVIAEGVESEAQSDALRSAGCPLAQGFLFSRPAARTMAEGLPRSAERACAAEPFTSTCFACKGWQPRRARVIEPREGSQCFE